MIHVHCGALALNAATLLSFKKIGIFHLFSVWNTLAHLSLISQQNILRHEKWTSGA